MGATVLLNLKVQRVEGAELDILLDSRRADKRRRYRFMIHVAWPYQLDATTMGGYWVLDSVFGVSEG